MEDAAFAEMLKQYERPFMGDIVKGTIIEVRAKEVLVDIGYKSEGVVPLTNLRTSRPSRSATRSTC